jgi:peptidoglycan hydrolase-like protein with peptidoglycan-binding domain
MAKKKAAHRSVESLKVLLAQINALAPKRNKASDGWIGDVKHMARHSDHNPEPDGTVDARDFTNDPTGGCDMRKVCDAIAASKDKRVSYMICNGQIMAGRMGPKPWVWRKYNGANGHYHHGHISVLDEGQDDKTPWKIEAAFKKGAVTKPTEDLTVKQVSSVMHLGSKGPFVKELQNNLNTLGYGPLTVDGDFGDGTDKAVRAFQKAMKLKVDGWAGPGTLRTIGKELSKVKMKPKLIEAEVKTAVAENKVAIAEKVVDDAAAKGKRFSLTEWLAGAISTGGMLTVAKEAINAITETTKSAGELALTVGPWFLLGVVIVAGSGYIIYERRQKRLDALAVKKVIA